MACSRVIASEGLLALSVANIRFKYGLSGPSDPSATGMEALPLLGAGALERVQDGVDCRIADGVEHRLFARDERFLEVINSLFRGEVQVAAGVRAIAVRLAEEHQALDGCAVQDPLRARHGHAGRALDGPCSRFVPPGHAGHRKLDESQPK